MTATLRVLVAPLVAVSLALPSLPVSAQEPAPATAQPVDPEPATPTDTCPADDPSCGWEPVDEPASPPTPPPVEETPPPVTSTSPAPVGDDYEQFLRSMPSDFTIDYRFSTPDRKRKRDQDPGRAAKNAKRLGIAGGSLMLAGGVVGLSTLTAGLVMSSNAKKAIEGEDELAPDFDEREAALEKGEKGDRIAIIGGAVGGASFGVGLALLLAARGIRRRTYGAPTRSSSRGNMSDSTRRNLVLWGALLSVYGVAGIAWGAAIVNSDDSTKARRGKTLLALGGTMAGIGLIMLTPVLINRARRSARIDGGPMFVRGGGGGSLSLTF